MKPKDLLEHLEKCGSERVMTMLKEPERVPDEDHGISNQIEQLYNNFMYGGSLMNGQMANNTLEYSRYFAQQQNVQMASNGLLPQQR